IDWHWTKEDMAPISTVLTARKEKVDRTKSDFNDLMPVTIHFDGSIEPRKVNENKEYSMELFWVRPGDIVASKIDLKNGAVAIIPNTWKNAVVTNHFVVYEPNLEKLDPKFFHLLIQASFFKNHLWRNKSGAEGRKEVKLDFFEAQEIPIPPLSIQQDIVAYWENRNNKAKQKMFMAQELADSVPIFLTEQLGLPPLKEINSKKAILTSWKNIDRWGVKRSRELLCQPDLAEGTYPVVSMSEVMVDLQNGWSPKCLARSANAEEWGVLKLGAISYGEYDETANKALPPKFSPKEELEVKVGDILINRGNILSLVGAITHVKKTRSHLMIPDLVFRVVGLNNSLIDTDFLVYVLRMQELKREIESIATGSSPTMKKVTKPALLALRIPLPPIEVQKEIIKVLLKKRAETTSLFKRAKESIKKTEIQIEQMILGTISVEDI
ncbi:MAG: restriction endonuclease subunit S, partial [SAR324 cluster bacterium]|nr:restriction endonuclease subunit S [SAR324 cluster bacterium]